MNNFILEMWNDEGRLCTFYTVRYDGKEMNETDKFLSKYEETHSEALGELLTFIIEGIGENHGANEAFFNRAENEVHGLPLKGSVVLRSVKYHFPKFPLRLYALKVRENIVILFNGGIKDGPTNQTSSLVGEWRAACQFARKIYQAIIQKDIIVDEENSLLLDSGGTDEILLY